jgi:hypothetical protein
MVPSHPFTYYCGRAVSHIFENKTMKLLICTFFTLLLIGSAGGSSGQVTDANGYVYVDEFEEISYLSIRGRVKLWRA